MDSDDPQQPAVGESAGKQLKKAREKLGLSIKDVADAQHLRASIIQAIEDGEYEQIDSELFLKGYVRGYAKQVGADADALIDVLDLELAPLREERAKQEQENPLVDIERRRRKKRQVAKFLIIIVMLGVVAFAAWKFILEPRFAVETPSEEPEVSSVVSEADTTTDARPASDIVTSLSPPQVTEPSVGADTTVVEMTEVETVVEEADAPEAPVEADAAPAMSPAPETETADIIAVESAGDQTEVQVSSVDRPEEVALAETSTVAEPVPEPEEQVEAVNVAEEAGVDALPQPELEISFIADCWVQVRDAQGNQLLASLQRAGDELRISGEAPLKVVIGAVDAVGSIRFDGEPVNIAGARIINNRTELTLTP